LSRSRSDVVSPGRAAVLSAAIGARRTPHARVVAIRATEALLDSPATPGPWLFYPEMGPTPGRKAEARTVKTVRRAMARVLKLAGLPQHFTPHSLRHSFGSQLIAAGVSPAYVQQQMGHRSISMTVDIYGSWLPIRSEGAVDGLSSATAPDSSVGDTLVTNGAFQALEGRKAEHA
jgi:integrase